MRREGGNEGHRKQRWHSTHLRIKSCQGWWNEVAIPLAIDTVSYTHVEALLLLATEYPADDLSHSFGCSWGFRSRPLTRQQRWHIFDDELWSRSLVSGEGRDIGTYIFMGGLQWQLIAYPIHSETSLLCGGCDRHSGAGLFTILACMLSLSSDRGMCFNLLGR